MISVFLGSDSVAARTAAMQAFIAAQQDDPGALVTRFDDLTFDLAAARERLNAESLFGGGNILFLDGIMDHADGEEFYRTVLAETPHVVIIREGVVGKDILAFFDRIATLHTFDQRTAPENSVANNFALTDALGARNKKQAWVEFELARRSGRVMEEVHGTIFWIWKSMYLAATQEKATVLRTGMKEYPYAKALKFSKNYDLAELDKGLRNLKDMYHQAHRGEGDLEYLIERFILDL